MNFKSFNLSFNQALSPGAFVFVPGMLVFGMGLAVLFAPSLVVGLIAGLCFFVGGLLLALAWRFIQFKRKFEHIVSALKERPLAGQIILQQMPSQRDLDNRDLERSRSYSADTPEGIRKIDQKKIILH